MRFLPLVEMTQPCEEIEINYRKNSLMNLRDFLTATVSFRR